MAPPYDGCMASIAGGRPRGRIGALPFLALQRLRYCRRFSTQVSNLVRPEKAGLKQSLHFSVSLAILFSLRRYSLWQSFSSGVELLAWSYSLNSSEVARRTSILGRLAGRAGCFLVPPFSAGQLVFLLCALPHRDSGAGCQFESFGVRPSCGLQRESGLLHSDGPPYPVRLSHSTKFAFQLDQFSGSRPPFQPCAVHWIVAFDI